MFKKLISRRLLAAALSFAVAAGAPAAGTILELTEQDAANSGIVEQIEQAEPQATDPKPETTGTAPEYKDADAEEPAPPEQEQQAGQNAAELDGLSEDKLIEDSSAGEAENGGEEDGSDVPLIQAETLPKLSVSNKAAAPAAKGENDNSVLNVSISVSQKIENVGSSGNYPRVEVTVSGLSTEGYKARVRYTTSSSQSSAKTLVDGKAVFEYPQLYGGRSYGIYAEILSPDNAVVQRSDTVTINAVGQSKISNDDITVTPSIEGQSTGKITVAGGHEYLVYYRQGSSIDNAVKVSGSSITGLAAGTYYVFLPAFSIENNYYISSGTTTVKVGETPVEHYNVTIETDSSYVLWQKDGKNIADKNKTASVIQGLDTTLEYQVKLNSQYKDKYIVDVSASPSLNADINVTQASDTVWNVAISNIRGDVTVTAGVKPIPEYTVTLAPAEGAKWSDNSGKDSFSIKTSGSNSVYVKPTDTDRYYISGVRVEPEGKASVSFSEGTGEVYVTNVTGDITLTPQVIEKSVPSTVSVTGVYFNENGIYSESNPAILVNFTVEVKDQFGETVPGVKVYFKDDKSEVSWTQNRTTGSDGKAEFKYSYSIAEGNTTADYTALFSTDSSFADGKPGAPQDIHLKLQRKADLVLYEDQIVGTAPDENNGRVINVPDNYEIWTGEVHQGALVTGSGEWVGPVNGEFTGLSSGQHILRAGEYVDDNTNTFYFASDYADFFVPRGVWKLTVDTANSENVVFTGETELTAEPGGTVYVYVEPEEGYEIKEYFVDKPNRIQNLSYNGQTGYIVIESITGNIVLTVKAEKLEDEQPEQPEQSEQPEQPEQTEQLEQTEQPEQTEQLEQTERPEQSEQSEPPEDIIYSFIEDSGSTWLKGSGIFLRFRAEADLDKFTAAKLDGQIIPKDSYKATRGSTIITIAPEYLEKLSLGAHTLTLEFTDGYASTGFTVRQSEVKGASDKPSTGSDAPKTGDHANGVVIALMALALLLSAAVLIVLRIDDTWLISVIKYIR